MFIKKINEEKIWQELEKRGKFTRGRAGACRANLRVKKGEKVADGRKEAARDCHGILREFPTQDGVECRAVFYILEVPREYMLHFQMHFSVFMCS